MKRKGFTLIELLAVIVILAIIALIAVPVVMNIITKANKSAFKDTAYGIIKAGELYYADQLLEPNGMESDASFQFPNNLGNLQIKGSLPTSGNMKVNKEGDVALAISNGKYCVKKGYSDSDIAIDEDLDNCLLPSILSSTDKCIKNGVCSNGTKVNVKVNNSENYDFYVIKDTGTELTLIMNKNLGSHVSWINEADYKLAGGTNWAANTDRNSKGPLTALAQLETLTSKWNNIPFKTYTLTDDGGGNKYQSITRNNVRARMLTYTEATELGCTMVGYSCMGFLCINLDSQTIGYWLSSAEVNTSDSAWYLFNGGNLYMYDITGPNRGVRPVITVSKSL